MPLIMEECADAETRDQVLRILQEAYGTEAVIKWGTAIMDALQQTEVLRPRVYESSVSSETKDGDELDDSTLPRPELVAGWLLRDMRQYKECGRTSQGQQSAEQRHKQSSKSVQELSYKNPSSSKEMFDMWSKGQGLWILQQTLYQIQKVWKSASCEWKGGDRMNDVSNAIVRRLTPL